MHLKRMAIPRSWPLKRKGKAKYAAVGKGAWPRQLSLPLVIVLRDMLQLVASAREAKKALGKGEVLVNGKQVKEPSLRVGLFDQLYIKPLDKAFSLELGKRKLQIAELSRTELGSKLSRVIGKRSLKGAQTQLNLEGGMNIVLKPGEAARIAPGDSVLVDLEEGTIKEHLKFEKGASVLIVGGSHQGEKGKVSSIGREIRVEGKAGSFNVARQNLIVIK